MTLEEFVALFDDQSIPIAFDHFKTAQNLPYLVYIIADNDNLSADNVVYHTTPQIQLELYSETKDTDNEEAVEDIIGSFFYEKNEGYLTDEQMYMVTYRFILR